MWKLSSDKDGLRTYTNSQTSSKCEQNMCYTDKDGNQWWEFASLTSIPYTRQFAATKITSLYSLGLTKDDLTNHITSLKTIIKSDDREKYEKAFANLLDFESKATNAADPIKQMSSLVCVYFTMNDEPIDSFDGNLQLKKMLLLEADIEMHSFFLSRQIEATERYTSFLNQISQIASAPIPDLSDRLP